VSNHVLLVEGDRALRSLVASVLRIDGFVVHETPSLVGARLELDEGDFDLAIIDVNLPGASGLDLAQQCRDRSLDSDLPIVLVTAFPSDAIFTAARRLRSAVLGKPFALADLRRLASASVTDRS
jgi:DNA-binding response OmpR family regulator